MDDFTWPDEPTTFPAVQPVFDGANPREVVDARPDWRRPAPAGKEVRPQWSRDIAMDVALKVDPDDIMAAHDLQYHEYAAILKDPQFVHLVDALKAEMNESGVTFKFKAQMMADALVDDAFKLATDATVDPRVRTRNIENMVRWAGYDAKAATVEAGSGFTFEFNFSGSTPRVGDTFDGEIEDA